jgi:hypothetical protein
MLPFNTTGCTANDATHINSFITPFCFTILAAMGDAIATTQSTAFTGSDVFPFKRTFHHPFYATPSSSVITPVM